MKASILENKTIWVNLGKNKISVKDTPKEVTEKYVGGRGVNARYLWDLVDPKTDPLGEENVLIFGTGLFVGTTIPTAGQLTITSKSPATKLYFKSNAGGHFALALRFAGYSHIVIRGISEKPVYLLIDNERIEIKDASHLWGKDVRETNDILKKELGQDFEIACIGPAGENLVKFALIMVSVYHAAARGGLGAVMGSKKLKAIAVRGDRTVSYTHLTLPTTERV